MASRFADRVAIVTGSSRGIGLAVADRLVAEGARVCITARRADALDEAVAALGPDSACSVAGKVDDPELQDEVIATCLRRWGRIDHLVNNTGINPAYGPLLDVPSEVARKVLDVNGVSTLSWVQKVYRAAMGQHGGSVVNIASVAGLRPAHGIGIYGASKAALLQLTAQLAVELGPGVRVNAVAPAIVKTRFATALFDGREDEIAAGYPLRRLGVPEDVASAVAFLLSDDASWITGQALVVDGGQMVSGGVGQ